MSMASAGEGLARGEKGGWIEGGRRGLVDSVCQIDCGPLILLVMADMQRSLWCKMCVCMFVCLSQAHM